MMKMRILMACQEEVGHWELDDGDDNDANDGDDGDNEKDEENENLDAKFGGGGDNPPMIDGSKDHMIDVEKMLPL